MKTLAIAVTALGLCACAPTGDVQDAPRTSSSVSTLVRAEAGPGQQGAEFVVEVTHGDDVSPDEARDLAANIRIVKGVPALAGSPVLRPGHVAPSDAHWLMPADHDVEVHVVPVEEHTDQDEYDWEWIDHNVLDPHCPPGH